MENLQYKNANNREGVWNLLCYGFKEDNMKWNIITKGEDEKMLLILKRMTLTILKGNELVESFSFSKQDIKRIVHENDSMAFTAVKQGVKQRSLRLRFAGGMFYSGEDICNQCTNTLSHYVTCDQINKDDQTASPNNMSLTQFVSEFLKNNKRLSPQKIKELETIYPLEDIIDDCVLDVNFPDIVVKVRDILDAKLNTQ